jgi:hypothetical protein
MVRPRKSEAERRRILFRIRVNEAEQAELEEAAQSQGQEASTWAREVLLALARRLKRKQPRAGDG